MKQAACTTLATLALVCGFSFGTETAKTEWNQWRGPTCDGVAPKGWLNAWPQSGPKVLWKGNVGVGCCSLIVCGGKVYGFGSNGNKELDAQNKSQDVITCFDAETGKEIWKQTYDAPYFVASDPGGPNATPACDGKVLVTESKQGVVRCHEAATGKLIWERRMIEELQIAPAKVGNSFMYGGIAASPLIHDDIVIARFGTVVGMDKATGKTLYEVKVDKGGTSRSSSPVLATVNGSRRLVVSISRHPRAGFLFVDPATGKAEGEVMLAPGCLAFSSDPVIFDKFLFISTRPGKENTGGSQLFPLELAGNDAKPVWQVVEDGSYWGNAARWGEYIFEGDDKSLACIEIKTGVVKWREKSLKNSQPVVCDGKLLVMNYNKLMVLEAGPELKILASADVLPAKQPLPYSNRFSMTIAVAPGRLYCKQCNGDVACLEVGGN
jgi:outer membrane protein assembly factor BamB